MSGGECLDYKKKQGLIAAIDFAESEPIFM
jgi:hypothetical protein